MGRKNIESTVCIRAEVSTHFLTLVSSQWSPWHHRNHSRIWAQQVRSLHFSHWHISSPAPSGSRSIFLTEREHRAHVRRRWKPRGVRTRKWHPSAYSQWLTDWLTYSWMLDTWEQCWWWAEHHISSLCFGNILKIKRQRDIIYIISLSSVLNVEFWGLGSSQCMFSCFMMHAEK